MIVFRASASILHALSPRVGFVPRVHTPDAHCSAARHPGPKACPQRPVLLGELSVSDISFAIGHGVAHCVHPLDGFHELIEALRSAVRGCHYFSSRIQRLLIETSLLERPPADPISLNTLTPRQWEIARMAGMGLSNREIAE